MSIPYKLNSDLLLKSLRRNKEQLIKEINPRILTIPKIGEISTEIILSEFVDISNFSSFPHCRFIHQIYCQPILFNKELFYR